MIKYNICFMRKGTEVLLLNRERSSWMGCWNGIGGKLAPGETPRDSMVREIFEEAGIPDYELYFKGLITWNSGSGYGGMYTYVAEVPDGVDFETPRRIEEGILDWKQLVWILHPDNLGIASNVVRTLDTLLYDSRTYDHHCTYLNGKLIDYERTEISPGLETDPALRELFFEQYAVRRRTCASGQRFL